MAAACLRPPSTCPASCLSSSSRRRPDSTRAAAAAGAARAFPTPSAVTATAPPSTSSPPPLGPFSTLFNAPSPRTQSYSRSSVATRALAPDAPPDWTLDQIAGLVFGLGMMASFLLAYKVDSAVARQQRRDLGLCELCGGLNEKGSCREKGCPFSK